MRDGRLEGAATTSRFPVAFPLPAFASRSSGSRRGVGPSSRSAYRARPRRVRTPTGLPRYRTHELRPGWAPPIPRGRRCSPGQVVLLTGACRSTAASPYTPPLLPIGGGSLHEASTRVHAIHPSGLPPRPRRPDGTGRRSAFPRASHPADQEPTTHAEVGTGQRARTWNYALNITSVDPPIGSSLTTCDLASHDESEQRPKRGAAKLLTAPFHGLRASPAVHSSRPLGAKLRSQRNFGRALAIDSKQVPASTCPDAISLTTGLAFRPRSVCARPVRNGRRGAPPRGTRSSRRRARPPRGARSRGSA